MLKPEFEYVPIPRTRAFLEPDGSLCLLTDLKEDQLGMRVPAGAWQQLTEETYRQLLEKGAGRATLH